MSYIPYTGIPFIFCKKSNLFSFVRQCPPPVGASPNLTYSATPLVNVVIPPKKARVFNKPKDTMSKKELLNWASRNRYR